MESGLVLTLACCFCFFIGRATSTQVTLRSSARHIPLSSSEPAWGQHEWDEGRFNMHRQQKTHLQCGTYHGAVGHATDKQLRYTAYRPKSVCDRKAPNFIILTLHCAGCTKAGRAFPSAAEHFGFLLLSPMSLSENFTTTACGASSIGADPVDLEALDAMVQQELGADAAVPVFAMGFSNGGALASQLAVERPGWLAGIAPIAGHVYDFPARALQPTPVFLHWSRTDEAVRYNGCCRDHTMPRCCCGLSEHGPLKCVSADEIFDSWLKANNCAGEEVVWGRGGNCRAGTGCLKPTKLCAYTGVTHEDWAWRLPNELTNDIAADFATTAASAPVRHNLVDHPDAGMAHVASSHSPVLGNLGNLSKGWADQRWGCPAPTTTPSPSSPPSPPQPMRRSWPVYEPPPPRWTNVTCTSLKLPLSNMSMNESQRNCGDYCHTVQWGNYTRRYFVHRPQSTCASMPRMAVLTLHCYNCGTLGIAREFAEKADYWNMLLIAPEGIESSFNAGVCCGIAQNNSIDDVGLIESIVKYELGPGSRVPVFAAGLGNGGQLASYLAVKKPSFLRGIAPLGGHIYDWPALPPTAVFLHWALRDSYVRFHGCCQDSTMSRCCCGLSNRTQQCKGTEAIFNSWLSTNGCREVHDVEGPGGATCHIGSDCVYPTKLCTYSDPAERDVWTLRVPEDIVKDVLMNFAATGAGAPISRLAGPPRTTPYPTTTLPPIPTAPPPRRWMGDRRRWHPRP